MNVDRDTDTLATAWVLLRLGARAFVMVLLVALNTRLIAALDYGWAFCTSFGIQVTWWHNARSAARSDVPGAWLAYALGASTGCLCGMWLGR